MEPKLYFQTCGAEIDIVLEDGTGDGFVRIGSGSTKEEALKNSLNFLNDAIFEVAKMIPVENKTYKFGMLIDAQAKKELLEFREIFDRSQNSDTMYPPGAK